MSGWTKHRISILTNLIENAYQTLLPVGDLVYSHYDMRARSRVFNLISPITLNYIPVSISDIHFRARVLPMDLLEVFDAYYANKRMMERARAERPMYADLRPIFDEESQAFGLNRYKGKFASLDIGPMFTRDGGLTWFTE